MIETLKMKNFKENAFLADVSSVCWDQFQHGTDDRCEHLVTSIFYDHRETCTAPGFKTTCRPGIS